jgi:hypothetical protein
MNNSGNENRLVRFVNWWLSLINRRLVISCCSIAICLALSGCVKYDTGIEFTSLNRGEIVEHIQLDRKLQSFSNNAVQAWLASIEQRTKQAQGQLERLSDRELKVIIPFNNALDLTTKVNTYFNSNYANSIDRLQFNSHLQIAQNNFLVVVRNHLIYDIDLRSTGTNVATPKSSVSSGIYPDLNFSLQSPWGVNDNEATSNLIGIKATGRHMTWQLKPGELNHIDAIFWLPNPLGIGAISIGLVILAGYYLKYRQLPGQLGAR